jgi:pimeloyl-ACP methyl ester carboxylesterase
MLMIGPLENAASERFGAAICSYICPPAQVILRSDGAIGVMPLAKETAGEKIVVIAGYNGLTTANIWARHLMRHSQREVAVHSWRHANRAAMSIARSAGVTLIGHSLGGGFAQLIAQSLPAGKITALITLAPFAPGRVDTEKVGNKVGYWLNIVSARRWHDSVLNLAGGCFLGWRDQGAIPDATENYLSPFPHQDFYKMISDRCGAVEHGSFRSVTQPQITLPDTGLGSGRRDAWG